MTATYREGTASSYPGWQTVFTLDDACTLAAALRVPVHAVNTTPGSSWTGNGWRQDAIIDAPNGKIRLPSCVLNGTHAILALRWSPRTGALSADCQHTDGRGRLLDGHRRLVRDEDGQTRRAPGFGFDRAAWAARCEIVEAA